MDLIDIEFVKLISILSTVLEVMTTALLYFVEIHEYEMEVKGGGDCISQVEGQ